MKVLGSIPWKKISLSICVGIFLTMAMGVGGLTEGASAHMFSPQVMNSSRMQPLAIILSDNQPCKGLVVPWSSYRNGKWKIRSSGGGLKVDCRVGRTSVSVQYQNKSFGNCSVLTPSGNRIAGIFSGGSSVKRCRQV